MSASKIVASLFPSDDACSPDELASALALLITSDAEVEATTSAALANDHTTYTQPHDCVDLERQSLLANVATFCTRARSSISGLIRAPPLPYFTTCFRLAMASSRQYQIPHTPRVISPSPTPSEAGSGKDGYFPPVTRASARKNRVQSPPPIEEDSSGSDPEKRARTRSRDSTLEGGTGRRRVSGLTARRQQNGGSKKDVALSNGTSNGHLSPAAANKNYWREMSRSPSPLGLIPIHQEWRSFIHRHEIPRKILHVSIGFVTIFLYCTGRQMSQIHPVLLTMFIPIALTDVIRHRYWQVNRFYIRCLGALMRESEVDGYNGVISYLLGAWIVLRFCPKDVGVVSILLLSWCDTAASTFGRLWGHLTPKIRKGKSLAGTIAACMTGIITAVLWWGWLGPLYADLNQGDNAFAFQNTLTLPTQLQQLLGLSIAQSTITGSTALGVMSIVTGIVASGSEALDLFGWDDNLTIPVLCGAGLWSFLRVFT